MTTTIVEPETTEDVVTGLEYIEGIDFDSAPACEAWMHRDGPSHPAELKIKWTCPCGIEHELWCKDAWARRDGILFYTTCWMRYRSSPPAVHNLRNGLLVGEIVGTL